MLGHGYFWSALLSLCFRQNDRYNQSDMGSSMRWNIIGVLNSQGFFLKSFKVTIKNTDVWF